MEEMGSDPSHATVTHCARSRPAEREGSDPISSISSQLLRDGGRMTQRVFLTCRFPHFPKRVTPHWVGPWQMPVAR